uniref:MBL fold metallo-hydrolase n=1 Tax=Acidobacterium capsulatum TaxID=33075 RepID=A0A7V4XQX2_9BACT
MTIQQFLTPGLAQYSYLIASEGQAVVIDPMRGDPRPAAYAAAHALRITHVLETHIHADFASGAPALAQATGAELALSAYDDGELYQYAMPHRRLRDGERIAVGRLTLEALHTPGHTPEHLSFALYDPAHSTTAPIALFSGDFIFPGSLGRPDLLGEDAKIGLAHALHRSLHQRITHLPDALRLYPGHGAGSLCGAGIGEQAESTLGQERLTNLLCQLSEKDFVREILAGVPPMPAYYPRMKQLNAAGAAAIESLPTPAALSPAEVHALDSKQSILLDLRTPEAFAAGHVPGAIHIGAGASLPLWAGWLLEPARPITLVSETGDDPDSRLALARVGLDHVTGFLAGGMSAWRAAALPERIIPMLSPAEVEERALHALLLDVRNHGEWQLGHIPGARHLMLGDLPAQLATLSPHHPIITICQGGYRASVAASLLARAGFRDVGSLAGGMTAWDQHKLALQPQQ